MTMIARVSMRFILSLFFAHCAEAGIVKVDGYTGKNIRGPKGGLAESNDEGLYV